MAFTPWRARLLNKSNKNTSWKDPPKKADTPLVCLPHAPLIPFTQNIAAPALCISSCLFLWQVEWHLFCFSLDSGQAKVEVRLQSLKSDQVKQGKRCAGPVHMSSTGPAVSTLLIMSQDRTSGLNLIKSWGRNVTITVAKKVCVISSCSKSQQVAETF